MSDLVDVVYLDNHILVVNKQAKLPTQNSDSHNFSLHEACKIYLKKKFQKQGNVFCQPIHRLDKDVSGLVIFARTSKSLSRLNKQMREKDVKKTYLVKVEGLLNKDTDHLVHYLEKKQYYTEVLDNPTESAKKAELSFEKISASKRFTTLKVFLHTGRYHQIRAQLAKIGHPILGDTKYGATPSHSDHISLQHTEVSFSHPTTKEKLTLSVKPII